MESRANAIVQKLDESIQVKPFVIDFSTITGFKSLSAKEIDQLLQDFVDERDTTEVNIVDYDVKDDGDILLFPQYSMNKDLTSKLTRELASYVDANK